MNCSFDLNKTLRVSYITQPTLTSSKMEKSGKKNYPVKKKRKKSYTTKTQPHKLDVPYRKEKTQKLTWKTIALMSNSVTKRLNIQQNMPSVEHTHRKSRSQIQLNANKFQRSMQANNLFHAQYCVYCYHVLKNI